MRELSQRKSLSLQPHNTNIAGALPEEEPFHVTSQYKHCGSSPKGRAFPCSLTIQTLRELSQRKSLSLQPHDTNIAGALPEEEPFLAASQYKHCGSSPKGRAFPCNLTIQLIRISILYFAFGKLRASHLTSQIARRAVALRPLPKHTEKRYKRKAKYLPLIAYSILP